MAATAANSDFPTFLIGATFNFQIYQSLPLLPSKTPKFKRYCPLAVPHSRSPTRSTFRKAGRSRTAQEPTVAAISFPPDTSHLPKVGRFPAFSTHLPEGGQKPNCPESPLWPRLAFLRTHPTFRRWDDFPHFLLTFRRWTETVLPREPTVAAINFPPDTSHLPKVGRFPAFSAHLPKVEQKIFCRKFGL